MKASPEDQQRLLEVQAHDARIDRIAYQRRTLPQIARAAELEERSITLRDDIVVAQTEQSDLEREQRKSDGDVEQVRARATRDQQRLDSGAVTSPKELENLQSEIASLHRRQSKLEDAELDVMERLEQTEARVVALTAERESVAAELSGVVAERDAAFAELDSERDQVGGERTEQVLQVPEELRSLYEKLRGQHDGVGAAALVNGRCEGCHLALNPGELNRVRFAADDEVLRCEECRRILVRTDRS